MLRDVGVRTKLLAVLAIPTVLLMVVTALLVAGQVSAARRAGQVNALTDVAIQVNRVVHSLQEERSATLGYLQANDGVSKARMVGQRQFTNRQLTTLRTLVADANVEQMSDAVRTAVARSAAAHEELPSARRSVDAGRFFATEADVFYTKTIRTDLDLPSVVATSGTTELAQRLQAYEALSSSIEYAAHERDLVEAALLRGTMTESDYALGAALVTQQRQGLLDFQRDAPASVFTRLDNALADSQVFEIDQVRRELPDLLRGQDPDIGGSVTWVAAANSRISPMTNAESALVADIATVASDIQNSQEYRALVLVFGALVGLGLALMLAVALARRITRPLRRLTVAAGDIGAELPRMVERMQTPGEGPGVAVEPIPVESKDEIGQLAEAFNTVNDVTVQVAQEQAALRASIAEMFVNVARRNQVLLGRQLSQLDKMEAREEDPDVLDSLFKLDHLATRMRRNAESLLVLAGIDSTRRLRSTLPMSDVIRTAVGEIEAFDRIDLSMSEDPEVSGRHALTVAHLLAELLENATHFSNPDTRVVVSASVTGHGVDVTVTDYGLGMSEDEVADANHKIAHPPVAEIAVSQRLGLFVVGRLAARLGATVELRRGRSAGTVVAVALPLSVFEGLAAPEPVADEVASPVFGAETLQVGEEESQVVEDLPAVAPVQADDLFVPEMAAELVQNDPDDSVSVPQTRGGGLLRRGRRRGQPAPDAAPSAPAPVESVDEVVLVDDETVPVDESVAEPVSVDEPALPFVAVPDEVLVDLLEPVAAESVEFDEQNTQEFFLPAEPVESVEPVDAHVADEHFDEQQVDEQVAEGQDVPAEVAAPEKPARRGLFRRGRRNAPADERVSVDAEHTDESEHTDERERAAVVAELVEPGSVDESAEGLSVFEVAEPEPEVAEVLEVQPEPVAEVVEPEFVQLEPWPVAEVVEPEPQPRPAPSVPVVYAPAVDILPSRSNRPARGSRFGRHRQPVAPPVADAPSVPAAVSPPAPVAPVEPVAAPAPVKVPAAKHERAESPFASSLPGPSAPAPTEPPGVAAPSLFAPSLFPPSEPAPVAPELPSAPPHQPPQQAAAAASAAPAAAAPAAAARVAAAPAPTPVAEPTPVPLTPMPRRTPAQLPVAASAPLPGRTPAAPAAPAREQVVPPVLPDLDRMAAQAEMHSSALSELRGLYEPSFTPTVAPAAAPEAPAAGGLARRTPKAAAADAGPPPPPPARTRSASDVRGMLSGFRAGVERGRHTGSDENAADPAHDSSTS